MLNVCFVKGLVKLDYVGVKKCFVVMVFVVSWMILLCWLLIYCVGVIFWLGWILDIVNCVILLVFGLGVVIRICDIKCVGL